MGDTRRGWVSLYNFTSCRRPVIPGVRVESAHRRFAIPRQSVTGRIDATRSLPCASTGFAYLELPDQLFSTPGDGLVLDLVYPNALCQSAPVARQPARHPRSRSLRPSRGTAGERDANSPARSWSRRPSNTVRGGCVDADTRTLPRRLVILLPALSAPCRPIQYGGGTADTDTRQAPRCPAVSPRRLSGHSLSTPLTTSGALNRRSSSPS
jgi:hypothetical protein